ncbi:MAG: alpha/beta hydrolase fold protein [Frankiales bacterium]|nr:alpha/beta hydrolase fold protein [Frankiales bacterium]
MSAVSDLPLPEGVHARTIEIPGGPLAVLDTDPVGEHRGTVVMVPGFTGSKEDFRYVLEPLATQGFRVVAIDQRGQYHSPGPDDPAAYTVVALGNDVLQLVKALGDGPVHVVGHSFGGLVSRSAVLQDPTAFRSLVLMGSGPSGLTGPRADVLPFLEPVLHEGGLEAVWEASEAIARSRPQPVEVTAEVKDFLKARLLGSSAVGLLATSRELTSAPDRVDELAALDLPILVMYGEGDDAWLPDVQDAMAVRLGAPVIVVPAALHSPAAENPALTAQVLRDFLKSV